MKPAAMCKTSDLQVRGGAACSRVAAFAVCPAGKTAPRLLIPTEASFSQDLCESKDKSWS